MNKTLRNIPLLAFVLLFLFNSCSTHSFFYYPDKSIVSYPDTTSCRYEEVNFKTLSGKNLNGWFIKPKSDTTTIKATILFLHGNGGNIGYQFAPLALLAQHGFQGLVFDYEGYGRSEGDPSQESVLADAFCAMDYIHGRRDVQGTKLILFGQSLGAHLACAVAGKKGKFNIDAFVIEGAFSSHRDIAAHYSTRKFFVPGFIARIVVPSKYEAIECIDKITVPKLIIHSREDVVCPFFMGKELFEKAKEPKQFWEIKGAHIAGCRLYPEEYVKKFEALISQK